MHQALIQVPRKRLGAVSFVQQKSSTRAIVTPGQRLRPDLYSVNLSSARSK